MTDQPEFSPDVIAKAQKLLAKKMPDGEPALTQDPGHASVWWVVPSSGAARRYRVQSDYARATRTLSWITCTCPHGLNKGGGTTRCYHAAAVLLLIREEMKEKEKADGGVDGTGGREAPVLEGGAADQGS